MELLCVHYSLHILKNVERDSGGSLNGLSVSEDVGGKGGDIGENISSTFFNKELVTRTVSNKILLDLKYFYVFIEQTVSGGCLGM